MMERPARTLAHLGVARKASWEALKNSSWSTNLRQEEFEKNTKGQEKGVSADLRDPYRTLTEVPHKLTFSQ